MTLTSVIRSITKW